MRWRRWSLPGRRSIRSKRNSRFRRSSRIIRGRSVLRISTNYSISSSWKKGTDLYRMPAPDIRQFTAANPGLMTLEGTNQYLLGRDEITVVDVALSGRNLDGIIEQ